MKQIAIIFMIISIIFCTVINYFRSKQLVKNESDALTILTFMLLVQKDRDSNGILFELEKYSKHNRKLLNELRINYLKNNIGNNTKYKTKRALLLVEVIEILFSSGAIRAVEFLEGTSDLRKNDQKRIIKVKSEIVNSLGIVFTMVMMFIIIIYFLSPYTEFINI